MTKFIPHNYQRYCINRLLTTPALGLLLDMGLGKTVITLTAIMDLKYNQFAVNKVLVIAPKKVAESTWARETEKWDHLQLLRISTVLGSATKRVRALNTPADIYVINRENIPWLVEHYRNSWPFDMVIVDEFSSFKNHQAKRFKALSWVRPHIKRIVGLTGTPAPNGLLDLWAQVYLLDSGERLGKTIGGFRERYFEPDQRNRDRVFSYAPKAGGEEIIQSLIGDICVSMKAEDYLELPDITYNTIPVVLDSKAQKAYDRLETEMLLQVDESTIDAGSAAVLTNKLLQLCNGAVYDENREIVNIHDCKIEAFMELLEGLNGKPALVFYNFKHDKERIIKVLSKTNLRIRGLETDQDQVDWNNKQIDILLAHPASAAYGLNLQHGGNHVIWFGLNWSLELYQQANKRLHRQGQTEKVIIHHLTVAGGVDEDVAAALENKTSTQDQLMFALKARIERVQKEGDPA
ncbi:DEAD/DEAH box helicase [Bacillus sp. ISL-40]|uniref:DEAD/DEAH box helicase n=1 Tax=unclassified Bacillus (in: firmicutes) TaxID=185979 RepID=UPI001BECDB73|nr:MULTISPECIES: DEAD/DEAH box helicase [unclassified Bacillus (in: firmicutes)]MBT2696360.1 DEAD/DEAH box helicase [Bacillus sp. ISL-40]MBT2743209.1 DEAD/DEAH box helicase [Bacillus sp. ISL-77]